MQDRILIKDLHLNIGQEVVVAGWVDIRRDQGKMVFFDMRDMSGKVQCVVLPANTEAIEIAKEIRPEWVLKITGKVNKRPEKNINKDQPNGDIELEILKIEVLNKAQTPPFDVRSDGHEIGEDMRLQYRYLDLRRPRMQKNLRKRGEMIQFIRDYLVNKENFVEIETPILTKTSPEGARDFLVPSRLNKGNFYALPQSPQQYKQMIMVAGFEKYFQIARCFRDEDPRADRAYGEFTQLDLEMSFVEQEDILSLVEKLFTEMIKKVFPEKKITQTPWPRIAHKETMEKYGSDKPDLRKNKEDKDELAFTWVIDFPLFTQQTKNDFYHGSGSAKFAPSHHMFTAPHPDDISLLDSGPTKVRGLQHDLALNGYEVGGGSIRIHDRKVQEKVFDLIGFSEEQKNTFKHMLEAFTFGTPPHGGIAPGIDRLLLAITGESSLRELMSFPKTGEGQDLMMNAPSEATPEQLKELGIKTEPRK
ncbi:hypothetical protein A3I25_02570 [Candidatus Nomurabacteria bacterium RIFCSPLOWO2_02_FULL_42_17]|uniref:Aspartate--tRNA ligase n=2 Tax=Candidatus Nomuraibacteriota TaxID=1752729 RepID=A0A1F6WLE3_9BACT|nr:MAG: Aspartyl-tRNA synthetase [Parcubacteria group bacterium GW2011_GWA2_42_18]OGI82732.1 MAG: hypothetical protein A3B93_02525 [Candidatus Nomurabacteria bacterium RIFCSPHIGHO2_02_FULL_42_24]OGI97795.1 MAG: hypothetical protein A3I25_02570 [Candidatus Nomurabacteria bacterium RIFCSPLOWO2_02_FULL_42_17]